MAHASKLLSLSAAALTVLALAAPPAGAQSFRVQCPTSTVTHPVAGNNNAEPVYAGPTYPASAITPGSATDYTTGRTGPVNGAVKCQQIAGGDGYSTMADGTQTYMFSFGPLSGISDISNGLPGTEFPNVFNTVAPTQLMPGDPATTGTTYNGAVGLAGDIPYVATIYDSTEGVYPALITANTTAGSTTVTTATPVTFAAGAAISGPGIPASDTIATAVSNATSFTLATAATATATGVTLTAPSPWVVTTILNTASNFAVGDQVIIKGVGAGYDGTVTVTGINVPNLIFAANFAFQYFAATTGLGAVLGSSTATAASLPRLDGHVDPRQIMDVGVMNGNIPAPLMAIDEDDEFFLTLTNVGMIMRPDLFEQHTVHFHGYPNASSFYDGVPDASVAINIGGSFTYYYLAPDAGTYFWHCHITPPEHLQMGMVGQLYVRPRQNRWIGDLYQGLQTQQHDLRTACNSATDLLCSNPVPPADNGVLNNGTQKYAYNDGDGSTRYDVEYPLQIHGFDPNFHFVGMTFNPEGFADMKDKYFLLNGRGYPDTVTTGPMQTQAVDGTNHFSQPLPAIINIPAGGRALLRISDLDVSEYQTLASLGIPMQVIAFNAKLLRDQEGNNMYYNTNSITLGGGESLDLILDASDTTKYPKGSVFYLYTPNLDHLSNDAENFGGLMTEVRIN